MGYILGITVSARTTAAQFRPGSKGLDADGNEYLYVQAGGAINAGDFVAIDSAFSATQLTKTNADTLPIIGMASDGGFTSGQFGWVTTELVAAAARGGNMLANTTVNAPLYTTATAGHLSHVSTSQTLIAFAVATTTSGSNARQGVRLMSPGAIRGTVGA
ncbi:hypothetical protein UFOVP413_21 [uncultured Caudovirales phage]|uniref:Uncharacterized protein n=1 Tax=uncultured Caudovirales phage TaxID=2100421 RepID=A0A6J5M4A5_9CAUD|nr:hypothetical protein UFOVP413_21 [uncultured Caudovirales phage]